MYSKSPNQQHLNRTLYINPNFSFFRKEKELTVVVGILNPLPEIESDIDRLPVTLERRKRKSLR